MINSLFFLINIILCIVAIWGKRKRNKEKIKTQLTNIIKSIEISNELKDIFAKETYINQLRDRFNSDLDREKIHKNC